MEQINLPTTSTIQETEQQGSFAIEPLHPGYGSTLGNALRRVLLSSLEGAAVDYVEIDGAEHEFSTIPHVKEDVVGIILNLKLLRFQLHTDSAELT
jgi:DNA-directed RNA polymerase subunit alpha